MEISVIGENRGIRFGILIVSAADIGTLRLALSGDVLGILGIDANVGAVDCLAAGTGGVVERMFIGK